MSGVRIWACWVLALALVAPPVGAAELGAWAGGREPIQIDAESLEARAEEGLVVFRGAVVARQGELTLQADRLTVHADPDSGEVRTVEASGAVRIQRGDTVATGQEGRFEVAAGVVTLSGEAKAWQGRNVIAGTRIVLHLADNRMEVQGASGVLYPGAIELPR